MQGGDGPSILEAAAKCRIISVPLKVRQGIFARV